MYFFNSTSQVCRQSELHCSSGSVSEIKSYSLVLLAACGISERPTADDPSDLLVRIALCCYINFCFLVCRITRISLETQGFIVSPILFSVSRFNPPDMNMMVVMCNLNLRMKCCCFADGRRLLLTLKIKASIVLWLTALCILKPKADPALIVTLIL